MSDGASVSEYTGAGECGFPTGSISGMQEALTMISDDVNPSARAERQLAAVYAQDGGIDGAVAWARRTLEAARRDPSKRPLQSARALRRADRRLSLVSARYLVNAVSGRSDQGRGLRARNPLLR